MAILINAHQLSHQFGARTLFEGLSFSVEEKERIGLIGPNGAGKSTLLKILAAEMTPDGGKLSPQRGLRLAYLAQVPQVDPSLTVQDAVIGNLDPHDWEVIAKSQELMSRLSLNGTGRVQPDSKVGELSGGWQKRVALARELLKDPDLLLLDEPTNHLDIESVLWLEEFLRTASFATVTITHDRQFLQRISNRIIELDRRLIGGLLSVKGDYATYLETKEQMIAGQQAAETRLRNTLRRETEWLRRGPQARLKKQQARINRAGDLREEVDQLAARNHNSTAQLDFKSLEKNPKKLIEAKGIRKSYDGNVVIPETDLLIGPRTRLGLIGANGCGKSTLIRLLLGQESPDAGTVRHADRLQVSYFEQNRDSLDPQLSVLKTICPDGDFVQFAGTPVHAKSYLSRFLFDYPQMELPVGKLSGGEQARLVLARLMLKPANVLVLDEPTNDLDVATLDVLQEVLADYNGAVLLVSHDRYFLDQVSNQLLAFGLDDKGQKALVTFADLAQWEEWYPGQAKIARDAATAAAAGPAPTASSGKKRKLSYKEQRELDGMEATILTHESRFEELTRESQTPEVVSNANRLTEITAELGRLQNEIDRLYARWAELNQES